MGLQLACYWSTVIDFARIARKRRGDPLTGVRRFDLYGKDRDCIASRLRRPVARLLPRALAALGAGSVTLTEVEAAYVSVAVTSSLVTTRPFH